MFPLRVVHFIVIRPVHLFPLWAVHLFLIYPVHLKVIQGVHLIRCYHFQFELSGYSPVCPGKMYKILYEKNTKNVCLLHIVPVGVLSLMLTVTAPCAESFCLLLRDRDGLIGLGRNDPPGTN